MIIQVFTWWIQSLIDIFRRIHYSVRGAIEITGIYNQNKSKGNVYYYDVEHENETYQVYVVSPRYDLSTMGNKPVALWWIPGKKRAMRDVYRNDADSRRSLLTWDIVSAVSALLLLALFLMVYLTITYHGSGQSESMPMSMVITVDIIFVGAIVAMIVASVMRKKLMKQYSNM